MSVIDAKPFRDAVVKEAMTMAGCVINPNLNNLNCATHLTSAPNGICLSMLVKTNDALQHFVEEIRRSDKKLERFGVTIE